MNKQNRADQRKYHYIYKTTNMINQKYYVGMHSTNNLADKYIGSGTRLWRSIQHYGRENFKVEILEFLPDRKSLKEREAEIVNLEFLKDPLCMNIHTGGYGGWEVYNSDSELQRQKCLRGNAKMKFLRENDQAWKKKERHRKLELNARRIADGWKPSDKWVYSFKGKTHTQEVRDRISKSSSIRQAGEGNSNFGMRWMNRDGEIVRVKSIEADQLELQGWKRGKVDHQSKRLASRQKTANDRRSHIEEISTKIINSTVDRSKRGWARKMAEEIGLAQQSIKKFMAKHLPKLYTDSYIDVSMRR